MIPNPLSEKSSNSVTFETLTDLHCPLNGLRNLCSWLESPVTSALLQELRDQVTVKTALVLARPPETEAQVLAREQLIGELRGLKHLEVIVLSAIEDLQTAAQEADRQNNNKLTTQHGSDNDL